ncbi:MAG: glycosyltransferase family 4 protein [Bacteroidales bacterium]|nr:glycosyltransferase family 4 protein [Bacteroidales bacterium]
MAKLLYIWYKRSKGILEGGGQGSYRNYTQICQVLGEENVDSFYVHDEYRKKTLWGYVKGLYFTLFNYYYGLTPGRVKEIVRIALGEQPLASTQSAHTYDYVFIDRSLFGIIAKQLKQAGYKGRIMVFFHNVETIYFNAKLGLVPGKQVFLRCVANNDAYSCLYADNPIAINQRDADLLESMYGRKFENVIPVSLADRLVPADSLTEVQTRKRPQCLFLGAYFPPNNKGILWFVRNVKPFVDIEMIIVGKGMSKLKAEAHELKDIEVIGDAPDLRPYFEEADIMVLPIFSGSGMKIKTCESLMYGKNIVGTQEAFEGYEGEYSRIGGKCNTAEEFIEVLQNFTSHPRPRFNTYSRQLFLDKYSNASSLEKFKMLFQE